MKKTIKTLIYCIGSILLMNSCTNLDEKWYSEVTPENYFDSQEAVLGRLARPYTHLQWSYLEDRFYAQEITTDEMCITTKGPHWQAGGSYQRLHHHEWTSSDVSYGVGPCWNGLMQGVGYALDAKQDLSTLADYDKLLFPAGTKEDHLAQLDAMQASCYLRLLDFFGGVPIYTATTDEPRTQNTDVETFNHVESLLLGAIPRLYKRKSGDAEDGAITRGAAAVMLAQLYFNAEAYVRQDMYDKCAKVCQDILDGEYGHYELEPTWNAVFSFENRKSPELIWGIVSQTAKREQMWPWYQFYHYNSFVYFDSELGANNGCHLQPSLDPTGAPYTSRLGRPYSKFHDKDLRKKPYRYLGNMKHEGMFLIGKQTNLTTGQTAKCTQEYKGEDLVFIDQVAQFQKLKPGESPSILPSTIAHGEENSGVRLVKRPQPNLAEKDIRWNSYVVISRLAEVYYMLAECKMRAGDKAGAATLINTVRARNFENRVDPDPVTATNLDEYRMLDEWMIEFLGEGRRRTDLIRWNKFITEAWWDHTPSKEEHLLRFPVPTNAMSGNNLLVQNPGY